MNQMGNSIVKSSLNDSIIKKEQEQNEIENKQDINDNEVEFSVFCIENVASKLGIAGQEVYDLLTAKSNVLDDYIITNYEILHTQSKEYIINDIIEYMKECEVIK